MCGMRREYARQGLHITFTSGLALLSLVVSQPVFLVIVVSSMLVLVWFVRHRPESTFFLRVMERAHDKQRFPGRGAVMVLLGAFFTALLFPSQLLPALLVLAVSDGLSTIIGMRFGKKKIFRTKKSWVGSGAFFVSASAILVFFSALWFVIAFVVTCAEMIDYHAYAFIDDNVVLPLLTGALLFVL